METEVEVKKELSVDLDSQTNDILSLSKIETYRKIYMKEPIENEDNLTEIKKKQTKKNLEKQDDSSYLYKFNTTKCCTSNCLGTKINQKDALAKYQELRSYSKSQLDIFLLATIEALTRTSGETTIGEHKDYHCC